MSDVFLCWSGTRSFKIAKAIQKLLVGTLGLAEEEIFISDGIEKGVPWHASLQKALDGAKAGIACLTVENAQNPWLHFECGALSSRLAKALPDADNYKADLPCTLPGRLFSVIHQMTAVELKGPLSAYQATTTGQTDLTTMIVALAGSLSRTAPKEIPKEAWKEFEGLLKDIPVPARDLVPELGVCLATRAFNDSTDECTAHELICRYDEALVTLERLKSCEARVRAACPAHESQVFDLLLTEIERFARALENHILGTATIGPSENAPFNENAVSLCERRRLAVKSLASLLVRPPKSPLQEYAVRYIAAESDEERKTIILGLEAEVRRYGDMMYEKEGDSAELHKCISDLTEGRDPAEFRQSFWDLDRIYYYLVVRYFVFGALRWKPGAPSVEKPTPMAHDWFCGARDVTMELERYRLRMKGSSLLPLKYALESLQRIQRANPPSDQKRASDSVKGAVDLISKVLNGAECKSETGQEIVRSLEINLRLSMHEEPAPGKNAAAPCF